MSWILGLFVDSINIILVIWTFIGGAALGVVTHNNKIENGRDPQMAKAAGVAVGVIATPIVVLLSYGLFLLIGLPLVWHWLLRTVGS